LPLSFQTEILPLKIAKLVLAGEVHGLMARTALADDTQAGLAQLGGKNPASASERQ
jgi:hypothetical protein